MLYKTVIDLCVSCVLTIFNKDDDDDDDLTSLDSSADGLWFQDKITGSDGFVRSVDSVGARGLEPNYSPPFPSPGSTATGAVLPLNRAAATHSHNVTILRSVVDTERLIKSLLWHLLSARTWLGGDWGSGSAAGTVYRPVFIDCNHRTPPCFLIHDFELTTILPS